MTCPHCKKPAARLLIFESGTKACATCLGMSQNGGAKVSGILTRNSDRVRAQQQTNEADLLLPHSHDKLTGKIVPNEDFIARYPDKVATYFTQTELEAAGFSKVGQVFAAQAAADAAVAAEKAKVTFAKDEGDVHLKEMVKTA